MRQLWKLSWLLFRARLQYHELLSKQIIFYFTLVTSSGKVTTMMNWNHVSSSPTWPQNGLNILQLTHTKQNQGRDGNIKDLPEKFRDTSIVVRIAPCGEDKAGITESATWERGCADPWRTQCISYQCRGTHGTLKKPSVSRIPTCAS